jgi:hypothetical protein
MGRKRNFMGRLLAIDLTAESVTIQEQDSEAEQVFQWRDIDKSSLVYHFGN